MNLKSYLRGLGLGMVVCACIIGLSNSHNKITDAEIKARAAKLGMVEEDKGVLTQLITSGSESDVDENTPQVAEEDLNIPEITIVPAEDSAKEDTELNVETNDNVVEAPKDDSLQVANEKAEDQDKEDDRKQGEISESKTIVVTVYPGEGSYTVSKKLANLGLVESADVFDNYLCQNGYDKRLSTGNYTIAVGSSAEKIAKQLTGG